MSTADQGDNGVASQAWNATSDKVQGTAPEKLVHCMRITNIVNAIALIASGVITFTMIASCSEGCSTATMTVLAFYTLLFGLLLLLFEVKVGSSAQWIVSNCGFMYSNRGKAVFLLFLSTLCFSVIQSEKVGLWWFCMMVGIVTAVNGLFACFVIFKHPSFDNYSKAHLNHEAALARAGGGSSGDVQFSSSSAQPPRSDYQFGDAQQGGASFTSTPFASNGHQQNDNPFASGDNPFSHV